MKDYSIRQVTWREYIGELTQEINETGAQAAIQRRLDEISRVTGTMGQTHQRALQSLTDELRDIVKIALGDLTPDDVSPTETVRIMTAR